MTRTGSPYEVDQLRLEQRAEGRVYQLTYDSVSPTRVIGRDKNGLPIEETVCALAKSARFVDLHGNVCDVPLRTGRVYSEEPEAVRYEYIITKELIGQGQLPLAECPYTMDYKNFVGGPLVKPPPGESDCGGKPDGCEHMQRIIEARRKVGREKWKADQDAVNTMSTGEAAALLQKLTRAIGMVQDEAEEETPPATQRTPAGRAARGNLVRGEGEK